MTNQAFVQRAEQARDLRAQTEAVLGGEDEQEFQFYEWSPGRQIVSLWSMETGEEIRLPRYQAVDALNLRAPDGSYRFTADQSKAPEHVVNSTLCMFHKDSGMRPMLEEAGIIGRGEIVCQASHLAGHEAMLRHAEGKHRDRYRRYESAMERIERAQDRALQREQADAMLKLAGGGTTEAPRRGPGRPPKAQTEATVTVAPEVVADTEIPTSEVDET